MPEPRPPRVRGNRPLGGVDFHRRRNAEIRAMWASGHWTLAALAKKHRISGGRIWQIVNNWKPPRENAP